MFIFAIFIVLSIVLYVYYKVSIVKTTDPLVQRYFNAKSKICLAIFILSFGINQYLMYLTQLSLFIGIVFIVLGLMQLIRGLKETQHYRKEYRRIHA